jgi:hypothetical protein
LVLGAGLEDAGRAGFVGDEDVVASGHGGGAAAADDALPPDLAAGGGFQAGDDAGVGDEVEPAGVVERRGDVGGVLAELPDQLAADSRGVRQATSPVRLSMATR